MTAQILDGKATATVIKEELTGRVTRLLEAGHERPGLATVLVGEDPGSAAYVRGKHRDSEQIGLHAPKVLRQGAYPAWGIYANVYMGEDASVVEYRVDGGAWQPMKQVSQPDPRLMVENVADDLADSLRGYDRSPEATASPHLWRGALPTDLAVGSHKVEVRSTQPDGAVFTATTSYSLQTAQP